MIPLPRGVTATSPCFCTTAPRAPRRSTAPAIAARGLDSTSDGRPVFWLGLAPEGESFSRVRDLFDQARRREDQGPADRAGVAPPDHRSRAAVPDGPARAVKPGGDSTRGRRGLRPSPRSALGRDPAARRAHRAVSEVRAEAAETIGEVQTPQSVPALTDLATGSPDPAVRREAAEAFADQPPDLALPAIESSSRPVSTTRRSAKPSRRSARSRMRGSCRCW